MDIKNEIRIASIGNVDSAKSTTISVIANNILDDGKGGARSKILKHPHEKDTEGLQVLPNIILKQMKIY